MFDKIIAQVQW